MSDLTAAVEAAVRALIKVTEDEGSPCLDDEQDCFRIHPVHFAWYQLGQTGIVGETAAIARTVLAAAAPLIEDAARADERATTAEDIAQALLDVDPIEWALAGQSAGEDAAAIARQHAVRMPGTAVEGRTGADAYPTEGAP